MRLTEGEFYSFADLKNEYGKDRSYAFVKNDCVKAFILKRDMNPDFKDTDLPVARILVATGPQRESVAKKLTSGNDYPVFIKEETNKWRFVGFYTYSYSSNDPQDIKVHTKEAKTSLSGIAHMVVLKKKVAVQVAVVRKRAA